jgi:hypothetical protein
VIKIINPIQLVIDIVIDKYPDVNCSIEFVKDLFEKTKAYGETCWTDDGIYVQIDINTPFVGVIEVLAHELAHVAVGYDEEHGDKWKQVFDSIHADFNDRMLELLVEGCE